MRKHVRDVMTRNVVTLPANATIDAAIGRMLSENISGLPIVDDEGELVGVLTEYDVLQLCIDDGFSDFAPCGQFMTTDVRTIQQDADIETAARIFRAVSLRRLVVVEGSRPVGILSRRDVVRSICESRSPVSNATASN